MTIPSRSAKISNVFVGDGEYDLCLKIGQLIELQEKTGVGPYILAQRLVDGSFRVQDVIETIRLALIGGGLDPRSAYTLTSRYLVEGSLFTYVQPASEVVFAALMGVPDELPEVDAEDDDVDPLEASPIED